MKKFVVIVLALGGLAVSASGTARWNMFERSLGVFIRRSLYSVGEWQCQQHWRRRMSRAEYEEVRLLLLGLSAEDRPAGDGRARETAMAETQRYFKR